MAASLLAIGVLVAFIAVTFWVGFLCGVGHARNPKPLGYVLLGEKPPSSP